MNSQTVNPLNLLTREKEWRKRIIQVFGQWTFLERESIEQKVLERWREMKWKKSVMHEKNLIAIISKEIQFK